MQIMFTMTKSHSESLTMIHGLYVFLSLLCEKNLSTSKMPIQHSHEAPPGGLSHLRKHRLPPSRIRTHYYYRMNSLNSELQLKKEVPQSKSYKSQFDKLSANQETLMRRVSVFSEEENMSVVREDSIAPPS